MAKDSATKLVVLGVGGFVFYKMATADSAPFGVAVRDSLRQAFKGIGFAADKTLGPGGGGNDSGGGSQTDGYGGNPNFWAQAREWKAASGSRDWSAFRSHVIAIGAPDPGSSPPVGW